MKYRLPITIPDAKLNMSPDQYRVYFCIMIYSHPSIYSKRNVYKTYLFMFTFHLYKISAEYLFKDCHGLHHSSKIFLFQFAHVFPFLPFVILLI